VRYLETWTVYWGTPQRACTCCHHRRRRHICQTACRTQSDRRSRPATQTKHPQCRLLTNRPRASLAFSCYSSHRITTSLLRRSGQRPLQQIDQLTRRCDNFNSFTVGTDPITFNIKIEIFVKEFFAKLIFKVCKGPSGVSLPRKFEI